MQGEVPRLNADLLAPLTLRLTWLAMLLPFALWGTAMAAMKPLLQEISPLTLAWLRILPAAVVLLLAAAPLAGGSPRLAVVAAVCPGRWRPVPWPAG